MAADPAPPVQPQGEVSPFRLFQAFNAFQLTEAIQTAIELDIFTAIGAGHNTAATLARDLGIAERGARILSDFLVVHEFLTKDGGRYSLPQDRAPFLDRQSPAYMGSCTGFLLNDALRQGFRDLTSAVKHGGCQRSYAHEPDSPVWVAFARSMAP